MTWHDFVNSHFNDGKFSILLHMVLINNKQIALNNIMVKHNDLILNSFEIPNNNTYLA